MAEKVTTMVLKVDLQCPSCYKKVKKVLCKFPQIRNQVYDEKQNTVTITVVCCSPEKIRDKLCCKGGKAIKCIEIKKPEKPKPPPPAEKPKPPPPAEKPKPPPPAEKPKPPPPAEKPKPPPPAEKPKPPPPAEKPKPPPPAEKPPPKPPVPCPAPCPMPGPITVYPIGVCCGSCYEGRPGGPCYDGYGGRPPPPPPPCYDFYGRTAGYCDGYGRPCRCDYYFCEENPSACTIM
ncbi:leucine-rich repeat extensin-like protein 3 [Cornus florida]|uniref:leucine-rich repeat extensin-like protein 3 n=1 Tax=Cornus florida TaxID=4283 RepID=UPI00289BB10A|nr:leucine-rich repeat extensin-like protein 3 [Cornus florida]